MNNRSPRSRGILGTRPNPLKIRKDSHKIINKSSLALNQSSQLVQSQPPQEPSQPPKQRDPVIIYTVFPKIIHTHPNDFKTLVQRLIGKISTSSSNSEVFDASRGLISPAARFTAIERANTSNKLGFVGGLETMDQYYHHHHQNQAKERQCFRHSGILSPRPTSLPLISSDFFSSIETTDSQSLSSLFNDFRPILQSSSSKVPSPSSIDLFNNYFNS